MSDLIIGDDLESLSSKLKKPRDIKKYDAGFTTAVRKILLALTVTLAPVSFCGDGVEKQEFCFYPELAQTNDDAIRTGRAPKLNKKGQQISENNLLFGTKYCIPNQRYLIPASGLNKLSRESSNPDYNPNAVLNKGIYLYRESLVDNPFKGLASLLFITCGIALLAICKQEKTILDDIRPQYWATQEITRITSDKFLAMTTEALQEWTSRMVNLFAGIKEAKLRIEMWDSLTDTERDILDCFLNDDDRQKFGFFSTTMPEQPHLPHSDQPAINGQYELHPSEINMRELIRQISTCDGSTLLVASPGAGKSVTLNEIIGLAKGQNADITILSMKPDSFTGLADEGKVYPLMTTEISVLKEQFDEFYQKYQDRALSNRDTLAPLLLVLDDWLILSNKLAKAFPDWDYGGMILDILTVGRDFNTKLLISLQSFNLVALGIKNLDSHTRKIFNTVLLGNRYVKNGREMLSYGVIEGLLSNQHFISDGKQREQISTQYQALKQISLQHQRPICVAYCGNYWLGIMPNIPTKENIDKHADTPTDADTEAAINNPVSDLNNLLSKNIELSQVEQYVFKWVVERKANNKSYDIKTAIKNLKAITTPDETPKSEVIRYVFKQLLDKEYGYLNKDGEFEPNNF